MNDLATALLDNLIYQAVLPQKAEAVTKAEQHANKVVEYVRKELAAAGNDLNVAAPRVRDCWDSRYLAAKARIALFNALCKPRKSSRNMQEPNYADVDPVLVERFVKAAKDDAAMQYDAFVCKLIGKVGPVTAATLTGNHVWGHSFLTVQAADGEQVWKTQMILNTSKLGKVFNQFPTRKVKRRG